MRDITFGQYYPGESFTHKLDPRVKLLLVIAYITGVFLVKNLYSYIAVALFIIIAVLASRIPVKSVLKSVKGVLFIVVFTSLLNLLFNTDGRVLFHWRFITVTDGGIIFAVSMALRLVLLVIGTAILTLTTTPMRLTDGMESLMSPLKLVRFPVHDVAVIMSIALRFIPILMEEVDKIMMAQKARGASFDTGGLVARAKALVPVLIPLLVSAFRRAEELALAMDARCYNATKNRTKLKVLKAGWRDAVAGLVTAVYIVAVIAVNNFFWGLIPL